MDPTTVASKQAAALLSAQQSMETGRALGGAVPYRHTTRTQTKTTTQVDFLPPPPPLPHMPVPVDFMAFSHYYGGGGPYYASATATPAAPPPPYTTATAGASGAAPPRYDPPQVTAVPTTVSANPYKPMTPMEQLIAISARKLNDRTAMTPTPTPTKPIVKQEPNDHDEDERAFRALSSLTDDPMKEGKQAHTYGDADEENIGEKKRPNNASPAGESDADHDSDWDAEFSDESSNQSSKRVKTESGQAAVVKQEKPAAKSTAKKPTTTVPDGQRKRKRPQERRPNSRWTPEQERIYLEVMTEYVAKKPNGDTEKRNWTGIHAELRKHSAELFKNMKVSDLKNKFRGPFSRMICSRAKEK
jgi:hypothetical protein